jgi:predicted secreted hydrolase
MIAPTISASAVLKPTNINWKNYPYHPPGTDIVFPTDEGSHDEKYQIEWWYANFHLVGQSTGNEYGSFVAFYQIKTDICENQEIRLFSISDLATQETYTNAKIGTLLASTDHLDLTLKNINNDNENTDKISILAVQGTCIQTNQTKTTMTSMSQTTMKSTSKSCSTQSIPANIQGTNGSGANELVTYDHWYTKTNGNDLLPFQYTLIVGGDCQQDHQPMQLSIDMDSQKPPLIAGGNGLVTLGKDGFSYYYCLTRLTVIGAITVHGLSEDVIGYAWIDHQWGNFSNQNPPPYSLSVSYEWFSIKLDGNREIMVADTWDQETGEKINQSFSNGMNLLNNDGTLELLKEYTITPQAFWNDTKDHCVFVEKWHIIETSKPIDLTVTPVFLDQVMRIAEDYPRIQEYLAKITPGMCFWEGVCTVSGTIDGVAIQGKAYVELTHRYNDRESKDFSLLG